MNYIILRWSNRLYICFMFIVLLVLMAACDNKRGGNQTKALITNNAVKGPENINNYWEDNLCKTAAGNYNVLFLYPVECESCYPIIKEKLSKFISSTTGCKLLIVIPDVLESIKNHLLQDKLKLDSSRIKVIENSKVFSYLIRSAGDGALVRTNILEVTPEGDVVRYIKISPK
jgi:hypothetical protein